MYFARSGSPGSSMRPRSPPAPARGGSACCEPYGFERAVRAEPSLEFRPRVRDPDRAEARADPAFCPAIPSSASSWRTSRGAAWSFVAQEWGAISPRSVISASTRCLRARLRRVRTRRRALRPAHAAREARAVSELWAELHTRLPKRGRIGPASPSTSFATRRPPATPASGRGPERPRRAHAGLRRRALADIGVDPMSCDPDGFRWRTEPDRGGAVVALGRGRRDPLQGRGLRLTPDAVQLQQVWVDPDVRRRGYGARGLADLCRCCSSASHGVPLRARRERCGDQALRGDRMPHVLDYRSLLF